MKNKMCYFLNEKIFLIELESFQINNKIKSFLMLNNFHSMINLNHIQKESQLILFDILNKWNVIQYEEILKLQQLTNDLLHHEKLYIEKL